MPCRGMSMPCHETLRGVGRASISSMLMRVTLSVDISEFSIPQGSQRW